jgi:cellulase/cellobiase CelA1
VNFKIVNKTGANVNNWTLKINKNSMNITSSWNVNVKESGNYYVITPLGWNASIPNGGSVEFGACGNGSLGNIDYTLS